MTHVSIEKKHLKGDRSLAETSGANDELYMNEARRFLDKIYFLSNPKPIYPPYYNPRQSTDPVTDDLIVAKGGNPTKAD